MIKYVIHAKKWHDKVNGNTYHASRVLDTQAQLQLKVPFQYGYGDQFVSSSSNEMIKQNWIKEKLKGLDFQNIHIICEDNCKKKMLLSGGLLK